MMRFIDLAIAAALHEAARSLHARAEGLEREAQRGHGTSRDITEEDLQVLMDCRVQSLTMEAGRLILRFGEATLVVRGDFLLEFPNGDWFSTRTDIV